MKQNLSYDDEDDVKAKKPKVMTATMAELEAGFDPFIYQNVGDDKMDDLATYLKWHRDNPYCSTPRAPRRGVESQIAAGSTYRCDDNSENAGKVYVKMAPPKESDIPDEYQKKPIGNICNERQKSPFE